MTDWTNVLKMDDKAVRELTEQQLREEINTLLSKAVNMRRTWLVNLYGENPNHPYVRDNPPVGIPIERMLAEILHGKEYLDRYDA